MVEKIDFYRQLSQEALIGVGASASLSPERRKDIEGSLASALTEVEKEVSGRWNGLRWQTLTTGPVVRVMDGTSDFVEEIDVKSLSNTATLRLALIDEGMSAKSATAVVYGGFKRALFMLQAGVTSLEALERVRSRTKTQAAGAEGRQFHTKGAAPPITKYDSLRRMPLGRERRRI